VKTATIPTRLLALLAATLGAVCTARLGDLETTAALPPASEEQYQRAIAELETSEGAYGGDLSESLLGLAQTLQAQGRHEEAIKTFRRGIHLTRINEGLYSPQQIPLVLGEIDSYIAEGNYPRADERQDYLYRVQLHSLKDTDQLADALIGQAQWQFEAYRQGLGGANSYIRLMNMLEMYQMAMQDVIEREGDKSLSLLAPLNGMLEAQYLISGYEIDDSQPLFGEDGRPNESLLRFKSYRARSYEQGNAIIAAIADIEKQRDAGDAKALTETMVMLGDWRLWNGRTEDAWEAYRVAETELARGDDAQLQTAHFFGEPVPLPAIASLSPLPPAVAPEQGDILLAFGVSESGRVHDLERMDDNELEGRQASHLMRQLRKTPFRPKFEAGQPVGTENIVKAFAIQ